MSAWTNAMAGWQRWKPAVFALALGLVAGPLVSNALGWQMRSSTAHAMARDGVIEQQAMVCEERARAENAEPGKLDWSGQSALAKRWSAVPGAKPGDSDVESACARRLRG